MLLAVSDQINLTLLETVPPALLIFECMHDMVETLDVCGELHDRV